MSLSHQFKFILLLGVAALSAGCDNKTPEEHIQDAQAAIDAGKPNVAIIELKNALSKDARSTTARALIGQVRFEQGDIETAAKDLQRAVDLGATDDKTQLMYLRSKNLLGDHNAFQCSV